MKKSLSKRTREQENKQKEKLRMQSETSFEIKEGKSEEEGALPEKKSPIAMEVEEQEREANGGVEKASVKVNDRVRKREGQCPLIKENLSPPN